jgi:ADP-ribose pyrophosphatase YjhB (NUDIX family)
MPHPLSQAEFDTIYGRVPRLCVEVVMVEPEGVVLTKRSIAPGEGLWHVPGSTLRFGEALVEAAHRVARDETGVDVADLEQIGVAEYVFDGYAQWPVSVVYLARPLSRGYRCDQTASAVRVFQVPDQLDGLAMIEQHRSLLLAHTDRITTRMLGRPRRSRENPAG